LLAACGCLAGAVSAADQAAEFEYRVKAAFLYNIALFVNWPATAFTQPASPFCIGILGQDPFGSALDEALKQKEVGGRKVVIQRLKRGQSSQGCHLLFVCRSEDKELESVLAATQASPILTVSDIDSFVGRGGMIALLKPETKIQLAINQERVQHAKLTISSRLLSLKNVHIVKSGGGGSPAK
jgi:hypothetical protein